MGNSQKSHRVGAEISPSGPSTEIPSLGSSDVRPPEKYIGFSPR
jgi:hypothetical protein